MNAPAQTRRNPLVLAAQIFVLGTALFLGTKSCLLTTVSPGEVGVRYDNLTGLLEEDLEPGWRLQLVGIQKVVRLPSHYLFINYAGKDALSIRTKDNNTVTVDVSIPYRIQPSKAWKVMNDGNHMRDGDAFRFERFAKDTTTDILRAQLAQLRSEDFYNTDRRLEIAQNTLEALNAKLADYHLEAKTVLIRASYFRGEYEKQLAAIQYNEQQKLLDGATQAVAEKQQLLDNYNSHTDALVAAQTQDWQKRIAELDRAYQVGFIDLGEVSTPGAARRKLAAMTEVDKTALKKKAAALLEIEEASVNDGHLLGIKNIEAETTAYNQRGRAEANGVSARLSAEGDALVAKVRGDYEARLNKLLNSPAGRAYVAYNAADNVNFAETLTFQAGDGIPSVLRLRDFANKFMEKK